MSQIADTFHSAYYASRVWQRTYWLGQRCTKYPADMWVYQEIITETRPNLVIETGTFAGGSALFLAGVFDLLEQGPLPGLVLTIDLEQQAERPRHPRIVYLTGSSTGPAVLAQVRQRAVGRRVMVILDSDHSENHVLRELELYGPLVSAGCYLIVEDTNVNGHPVLPEHGPGPHEAVEWFLRGHPEFTVDRSREKFLVTANPGGYLRRIGN
jgi:cephalosporin hydroxylase